MKTVLYNLLCSQPQGETKFHGGGEYAKTISVVKDLRGVVEENALRTKRLDEYINEVGLKNSSVEAKKQITNTHVQISNNTILRIIKKKKMSL